MNAPTTTQQELIDLIDAAEKRDQVYELDELYDDNLDLQERLDELTERAVSAEGEIKEMKAVLFDHCQDAVVGLTK